MCLKKEVVNKEVIIYRSLKQENLQIGIKEILHELTFVGSKSDEDVIVETLEFHTIVSFPACPDILFTIKLYRNKEQKYFAEFIVNN